MERPRIVLLVGLPGSGKSTWAASRNDGAVLSSDDIRAWLSDDPANQRIHRRVFSVQRHLLRHRLDLRRPVTYIDSTNLTPKDRRPYIALAHLHDADIEAIFFNTPLDVCLARNHSRPRQVPAAAIIEMHARLIPPTLTEGLTRITTLTTGH